MLMFNDINLLSTLNIFNIHMHIVCIVRYLCERWFMLNCLTYTCKVTHHDAYTFLLHVYI